MTHTNKTPGRVPPHSITAEEQLLSCCMLDGGESLAMCIEAGVKPETFYVPANRLIFDMLISMSGSGKPIDSSTLAEELITQKKLDGVGGFAYVARISGSVSTTASISFFIEKVMELALLRDIIRSATGAVEDCYNYTGGIGEFADKVERDIMCVTQRRIKGEQQSTSVTSSKVMEKIMKMIKTKGAITGLPTGFSDLDRIVFGLNQPDLIILAGRPSTGKTGLSMNIVENIVLRRGQKHNVMVFSMEMSSEQLVQRMMCSISKVPSNRIRAGLCGSEEIARLEEAERAISNSGLIIDDSSALTVLELRARARRMHQKSPLSLVVVDYLQLMSGTDSSAFREQQIAECSRGLKAMAKELGVPVIVLSQLNRSAEKENRRPRLSDLRESGSIEQDADVVLMLSRPKTEDDTHQVAAEKMELIIGKNRNGAVDDILLTFHGSITRFSNYTGLE